MTTGLGINVKAVTTLGRKVTLYSISLFEHQDATGEYYVAAVTTAGAFIRISTAEAKRIRRTANKSYEQEHEGDR